MGGERRRVRAAGAVRGPVRVALPRQLDEQLSVEEEVGGLLAMAAGEDDGTGPQRMDGADDARSATAPRSAPPGPPIPEFKRADLFRLSGLSLQV